MVAAVAGTPTSAELVDTSTATTITVTTPTGAVSGDVLVAWVTHHTTTAPVLPAGWTSAANPTGTNQTGLLVCYRVLTAAPAANYTFTIVAGRSTAVIATVRGADTATFLDVAFTNANSASATSIVHPSATTVATGVFTLLAGVQNTATSSVFTWPAEMTAVFGSTANVGKRLGVASEVRPTPGAIGTRTITSATSSAWNSARIHIRSAAATIPSGSATGSWTFTGAASGRRQPQASASGAWSFTGAAVGARSPRGQASGTWAFVGAAIGVAPIQAAPPHTYVTATLADSVVAASLSGDGASLAALAMVSLLDATLAITVALAELSGDGTSLASLATAAPATATLAPSGVEAALQTTT